ncbi:MAG TPA: response regulator transcription factor [Bryobacteraceae bacterium]|nr:response regulator transcription factor [Bryobacteraceae bacterium]
MASLSPVRILVTEDHLIARKGLTAIINARTDLVVVAEAVDGEDAIQKFRTYQPDVTIMDMRMPRMSGFDAIGAIRAEFPSANIIAISAFGGDQDIRRALKLGARSYLLKGVLEDQLIEAIRSAHAGKNYLPPEVADSLKSPLPAPNLTARELNVLTLLARGLLNKQIAAELGIAEYTVKNHVKKILEKLGVDDRTQAATSAIMRGVIHI